MLTPTGCDGESRASVAIERGVPEQKILKEVETSYGRDMLDWSF
jgi:hypothetical protein